MAPPALELQTLSPTLALWQAYDSTVKADLFSTALFTDAGLFLVDPIALAEEPLRELLRRGSPAGVFVTNGNHFRAASAYVARFAVPLFAHGQLNDASLTGFAEVNDGSTVADQVNIIAIEGAAPGEIALYQASGGGTLIIGDALINFEPYGFTFLPDKYCENPKQMRQSLRKLLPCHAERILFAHGWPILAGAHARLKQLLDVDL